MEMQDKRHIDELINESHMRYLTFLTDRQLFGLSITEVVQITQLQEIIPLLGQPYYVKGMINLRGQIIPVIDVRLRFGIEAAAPTERTCIIISHVQGSSYGLLVDEVDEVVDIEAKQISKPPKISAHAYAEQDFLTGIAQLKKSGGQRGRVVLLLDAGKILGKNELISLTQSEEIFDAASADMPSAASL